MRIIKCNPCDATNGPGVRYSIWIAGCGFHCKSCWNSSTWNFDQGLQYKEAKPVILEDIGKLTHIQGVSILGGEPLWRYMYSHDNDIYDLCKSIKVQYPKLDIWMWTGFEWDKVKDNPILKYIDTIITGPFIEKLKDLNLQYMGSSNQEVHYLNNKNNE